MQSALGVINAILFVAENGCKMRALPPRFGKWHTVHTRMRRWADAGVLDRLFDALQKHHMIRVSVDCPGLDSTSVKVHRDGTGAPQNNGPQAIGESRGGWNTKVHLIAANDRFALTFSLSGGNAHDAPEGRLVLENWPAPPQGAAMIMDRANEGDETRQLVLDLGIFPVVSPKANQLIKWEYDPTIFKRRNEDERPFRRRKGYRRIFSRFEKLDVMYRAFLNFALLVDMNSTTLAEFY
jgi:transposase